MNDPQDHIRELDKKITALSDALARLGQGTTLKDLLKVIHFPGYTTPAEFAFTMAMLNAMQAQVTQLETMGTELLAAGKLVPQRKE